LAQPATAAYRADLGARDKPFGALDGEWITVASVLEHATLVDEPAKSELLRQAVELATGIVGEAEVQRLAAREWQDLHRSASEAIVILSDQDDVRGAALNLMRFFEDESCGQCTPCRSGTQKARVLMEQSVWDTALLDELSQCMRDASICGLGQAASNPLTSVIRYFPELFPAPRPLAAE